MTEIFTPELGILAATVMALALIFTTLKSEPDQSKVGKAIDAGAFAMATAWLLLQAGML